METIKLYLDNIFAGLPKNTEVLGMKNELLIHMEDKYQELIDEGKNEGEAVRIVITEFGNIEELLESMDYSQNQEAAGQAAPEAAPEPSPQGNYGWRRIDRQEGYNYIEAMKTRSRYTALGTFFCITGPGTLVFLGSMPIFNGFFSTLGLVIMLAMIAVGVMLFIVGDQKVEGYKYIRKEPFFLEDSFAQALRQQQAEIKSRSSVAEAIAVGLFILCPAPVIIFGNGLGVFMLLFMVACGVYLTTFYEGAKSAYKRLLKGQPS